MKKKEKIDLRKAGHNDLPATVGLVKAVRNELRADIRSLEHKMDGVEHSLRAEIHGVEHGLRAEIHGVRAEVHELKAEIQDVKADVQSVKADIQSVKADVQSVKADVQNVKGDIQKVLVAVHRNEVLMEEQRSENRIVLDGLKTVLDRQARIESELQARHF